MILRLELMILEVFSNLNDPVIRLRHHPQREELYQVYLATDPDQTFKTYWEPLWQVAVKQNTHAKSTILTVFHCRKQMLW